MNYEKRKEYEKLTGINHVFWRQIVTNTVLKRDNYKCVKCGSTKRVEVSHNRYGGDLTINDLETLCRSCHKKKDYEKKLFVSPSLEYIDNAILKRTKIRIM